MTALGLLEGVDLELVAGSSHAGRFEVFAGNTHF